MLLKFIHSWWQALTQIGLPALFLAADVALRLVLDISVADAGTDMALTSFAGLITLAIDESTRLEGSATGPALLLSGAAFVLWLLSLIIVANSGGAASVLLAAFVGGASMVLFVWLVRDVVSERRD